MRNTILMTILMCLIASSNLNAGTPTILNEINEKLNQKLLFVYGGGIYEITFSLGQAKVKDITPPLLPDPYVKELSANDNGNFIFSGDNYLGLSFKIDENTPQIFKGQFSHIAISQDSKKVLYVTEEENQSFILYCKDLKTGGVIKLSKSGAIAMWPSWSPDGKNVAYYCAPDFFVVNTGTFSVCLVPSDGSAEPKEIAPPSLKSHIALRESSPLWSMDGRFIFFRARYVEKDAEVGVTYAVALKEPMKPILIASAWPGTISRDGKKLFLFTSSLLISNSDGSDLRTILPYIEEKRYVYWPKISLDDRFISFVGLFGKESMFYLSRANGSDITKISDKFPTQASQVFWVTDDLKKLEEIRKENERNFVPFEIRPKQPSTSVAIQQKASESKMTYYIISAGVFIVIVFMVVVLLARSKKVGN